MTPAQPNEFDIAKALSIGAFLLVGAAVVILAYGFLGPLPEDHGELVKLPFSKVIAPQLVCLIAAFTVAAWVSKRFGPKLHAVVVLLMTTLVTALTDGKTAISLVACVALPLILLLFFPSLRRSE